MAPFLRQPMRLCRAGLGTAGGRRSPHGRAAQVAAVASMGFEPADAHAALLACGKDVGRAIEWYAHCRLQATAQHAADADMCADMCADAVRRPRATERRFAVTVPDHRRRRPNRRTASVLSYPALPQYPQ